MDSLMVVLGPIAILMLLALAVVVAILYFLLPFAIFGIKPLLRNNTNAVYKQNRLLAEQNELLDEQVLSLNTFINKLEE